MGYEQAKTQYPWIRHMICKALLNIFEQRWFLCDHVCYQRNGTLCNIFHSKQLDGRPETFNYVIKLEAQNKNCLIKNMHDQMWLEAISFYYYLPEY